MAKAAKIFARVSSEDAATLNAGVQHISYDMLRKSRVILDSVACAVWREFLAQSLSNLNVFLWVDASPQHSGEELLSIVADFIAPGGIHFRRLLPQICLPRHYWDTQGKTLALVWALFLVGGPTSERVAALCCRVASVTTDFGTEASLADSSNMLITLGRMLGIQVPDDCHANLLPTAIRVPGWKHVWGGLIRFGLWRCSFFPRFLTLFKSIVQILRHKAKVAEFRRVIRRRGYPAAAEILKRLKKPPMFAARRWLTLRDCSEAVEPYIEVLKSHWHREAFGADRDGTHVDNVTRAFADESWSVAKRFVHWLTRWLTDILSWGGSCACHREDYEQRRPVSCSQKGRLLPWVFSHCRARLREGYDEAMAWDVGWFSGNYAIMREAKATVRLTYAHACDKTEHWHVLPVSLCLLLEPGMAGPLLAEYRESQPAAHHRVTRKFFDPAVPESFSEDVHRVVANCEDCTERLATAVQALRQIPIDDAVGEGPHASFAAIRRAAYRGTFAWVAASQRLTANLEDVMCLSPVAGVDVEEVWLRWSSLLRYKQSRKNSRRKRFVSYAQYVREFYHMGHLQRPDGALAPPAANDENDDDDADYHGGGDQLDEEEEEPAPEDENDEAISLDGRQTGTGFYPRCHP